MEIFKYKAAYISHLCLPVIDLSKRSDGKSAFWITANHLLHKPLDIKVNMYDFDF